MVGGEQQPGPAEPQWATSTQSLGAGGVEHRERVLRRACAARRRRSLVGPVGAPVAARVERDDAEVARQVGHLELPEARVDDRPRREQQRASARPRRRPRRRCGRRRRRQSRSRSGASGPRGPARRRPRRPWSGGNAVLEWRERASVVRALPPRPQSPLLTSSIDDPGHLAHVLTFDLDHRVGQLLDHLALLRRRRRRPRSASRSPAAFLPPWSYWSFDRPKIMVTRPRVKPRRSDDGRPRDPGQGDARPDRRGGARGADRARPRRDEHACGGRRGGRARCRSSTTTSAASRACSSRCSSDENEPLLERQRALYAGPGPLAEKWRTACDLLDEDVRSGYVRLLWELWAAGLADEELAGRLARGDGRLARPAGVRLRNVGRGARRSSSRSARARSPTLVGNMFQGIEIEMLAGVPEAEAPHREVLDAIGDLIARAEAGR